MKKLCSVALTLLCLAPAHAARMMTPNGFIWTAPPAGAAWVKPATYTNSWFPPIAPVHEGWLRVYASPRNRWGNATAPDRYRLAIQVPPPKPAVKPAPKPAPKVVTAPPAPPAPPKPAVKPVVLPPAPPKPSASVAAVVPPPAYTVVPYPGNWTGIYALRFGDYGTLSLHITDGGVITGSGVCGDVAITATGNIDLASHIALTLTYANGRVLSIGPAAIWNGTQLVGGGTAVANDMSAGYLVRFILSHN